MAGGGIAVAGAKEYPGKFTTRVLITCIVAAFGGLIFGYDLGVSGGVTSMDVFLKKFFPAVYLKESLASVSTNQYCKFDSETLTFFTSCLYLAALFASLFVASSITRVWGRRITMLSGGGLFLAGALLNAFSQQVWMLYVGRILLGLGIGFSNQSVPIYLSETAPYKYRGALNIMFQLFITVGILAASLANFLFGEFLKGNKAWQFSLGGAAVPALIITVGSFFLPDTPNSLIERGKHEEAKTKLLKLRGVDDVDEEFNDLVEASEASKQVKNPWRTLLTRKYRPQLIFAICIPAFQQLTGVNVIMFYAPVLFKTLGFGASTSLFSTLITSLVNVVATVFSIITVDEWGRRKLFLGGGIQMFLTQVVVGFAIALKFGFDGNPGELSKAFSTTLVIVICIYVAGFAWSWGPLGWLVPSEIFPLEVRSAAQSINVGVNMIFTFAIAQVFTTMLCHLKFVLFFIFSVFLVVMSVFIFLLLPETKGVPIEEMGRVWEKHWYWRKFVVPDGGIDMAKVDSKNGEP